MTGKEAERQDLSDRAQELVALVRERQGYMSAPQLAEGDRKLRRRLVAKQLRGRAGWGRAALSAAAVLIFGIAAVLVYEHRAPRPLTFAADELQFRFSEGTRLALLEGAKAHIESIDQHGARIRLDEGAAHAEVTHLPGANWLFDVGPFLITVKGTAFTAEWVAADERLTVVLEKGSIAVNGPLTEEAIMLRAGQKLTVRLREKETLIRETDAPELEAPPAPSANMRPEIGSAAESERDGFDSAPASAQPSSRVAASGSSWPAELARGNLDAILEGAERRGFNGVLAEASSDDLAALADAARYQRRDEIAKQALMAQRRRFARSSRAKDAGFLLGRLEEKRGNPKAALGWYQRYLEEAPSGTYSAESLGRKMIVLQRSQGDSAARPVAEEYVRRFPQGAYVATAQSILRTP